ncbi:MAG: uracil-DNA glycosylase [Candidatus Woesebacteria bacterium]|nr:MAG: uracil-DNA glycosylase [Candidatus Woesebacteria bacterium]
MTKQEALRLLKIIIQKDKSLPLRDQATQLVFGVGAPSAKIFFLGEAPGFYEDQKGEPFVGAAGKLLNQNLERIGIKRKDVFISNIVLFRPPANRDPEEKEIKSFEKYIDKMIAVVSPKIIVTLGRFSMAKFLKNVKISSVHGKIYKLQLKNKDIIVLPMFHPAAALRNPQFMDSFQKDFLKLKEYVKA